MHLSYHGLDLARFGRSTDDRSDRDGSRAGDPGARSSASAAPSRRRAIDILLQALALLPHDLHWRFEHIGGGEQLEKLQRAGGRSSASPTRIAWNGALAQDEVLEHYRQADLFALACRIAADGDRDGLPNVLVEASSQRLACVSTDISGVPELLSDGENGLLVPPEDPAALAARAGAGDPRSGAAQAARRCGRTEGAQRHSTTTASIRQLTELFEQEWQARCR